MKIIYRISPFVCSLITMVGVGLRIDWFFNLGMSLFAFWFALGGIKGLIDPRNFNWLKDVEIPKSPRGIRWYIAFVRFTSIVLLVFSVFLIYLVITGG
ncbi:hypothetical protein ACSU64_27220 [Bacillaceae bacterium C204]|uniref:hypothetical protein n=1 Tax=Neobacillus sp. 204 TaxID=3383351 RepID=UPI00397A602F